MGVPSASRPSPPRWQNLATRSKTCTSPTCYNRASWAAHRAVVSRPRRLFPTWGSSKTPAKARVRCSNGLFCRRFELVSVLGAPRGQGTRRAMGAEAHIVRVHLVFAVVETVDLFLGAHA